MAGIALTDPRRSQLLSALLEKQLQPQQNIRSGGELGAKLLAQFLQQKKVDKLQQEEAGREKTTSANQASVISRLQGGGGTDFMGRPAPEGDQTSLAQALAQLPPENQTRQAIEAQIIKQKFAAPKEPSSPFSKPSIKDFTPESVARFDGTNPEVLVKRPTAAAGPDVRDKKIADLRRIDPNLTEAQVIDQIDGRVRVTTAPDARGNVTITNSRTGMSYQSSARAAQESGLTIPSAQNNSFTGPSHMKPIAMIQPSTNLDNKTISESQTSMGSIDNALGIAGLVSSGDLESAFGPGNVTQRGLEAFSQIVSLGALPEFFSEETDAANRIKQFNQFAKAAATNNPRFPVAEQELVAKFLPNPNDMASAKGAGQRKYSMTLQLLEQARENEVAFLEGRAPNVIPRKPLGTKGDPVIVSSQEELQEMQSGGYERFPSGTVFQFGDKRFVTE